MQFVQVSAHNSRGDFMHCSNLSLMSNQKLTYRQSIRALQVMADEYALNGFEIDWISEQFDDLDYKFFADLLVDQ